MYFKSRAKALLFCYPWQQVQVPPGVQLGAHILHLLPPSQQRVLSLSSVPHCAHIIRVWLRINL